MLTFIHISDLHIGKKLYCYDLLDDQKYVLDKILSYIDEYKPDAVFISGDIYDRTNPSEEAIALLSEFLERLQASNSEVFVIAGNHDPGEKLSFLSSVVDKSGLHIMGKFKGKLEKRSIAGADIYMLPYIRTVDAKHYFPDSSIESLKDAMNIIFDSSPIDKSKINILLAHQAVIGAITSGSEDITIGGESPIPSSIFSDFDYVALGHIHRAQAVGKSNIRYSGSILKYSASEHEPKVAVYGRISDEGAVDIEELKLEPLHDVVIKKGTFNEIMSGKNTDDYVYVVLTDETDIPDAVSALMGRFPRFLAMEYQNTRTKNLSKSIVIGNTERERKPDEFFSELFEMMMKKKMSKEQESIIDCEIKRIWGKS